MIRFVLRFVAFESVLFVVGLMFLPRPSVLLLMLYSAFFGLMWDLLTRPETHDLTHGVLGIWGARWADSVFGYHLMAFSTSLVLAVIIGGATWGYAEHKLWETGNFGEPPWNRYVRVDRVFRSSDRMYITRAEFGVHDIGLYGIVIGLVTDKPLFTSPGDTSVWQGKPGANLAVSRIEDMGQPKPHYGRSYYLNESKVEKVGEGFTIGEGAITSSRSYYIELRGREGYALVNCEFRKMDESEGANGIRCPVNVFSKTQEWRTMP